MPVHCYLGDNVYAIYDPKLKEIGLSIGERNEPDLWINPGVLQALINYANARNPGLGVYHRLSSSHLSFAHRAVLGI